MSTLRTFRYFYDIPADYPHGKTYAFVLDFRTDEQANAALAGANRNAARNEIWTMQEADPSDFDHINNRARFERKMKKLGLRKQPR
jgi:hypothetical protein